MNKSDLEYFSRYEYDTDDPDTYLEDFDDIDFYYEERIDDIPDDMMVDGEAADVVE